MHPRLLSLILFSSLHLNSLLLLLLLLLSPTPVHSHPHASSSSNPVLSFVPSPKASLRAVRNLLAHCCRDATLRSHQSLRPPLPSRQSAAEDPDFYAKYQTLDDLQTKWNDLARRYPAVQLTELGRSLEDRPITVVRIGTTDPENPKRILINALQHAREWITASAATHIAERLAKSTAPDRATPNSQLSTLLRSVQVLIVPVANPDGYVYSHTDPDDTEVRFWRKNRRSLSAPCFQQPEQYLPDLYAPGGVDLNRNWGTDFAGPLFAADDPCHNTYTGTRAFSEPETQALAAFIRETNGIMAHIDFHSYGQVILGPWASSDEQPRRFCEYDIVGDQMAQAMISDSGVSYKYGRGKAFQQGKFSASGVMTDWVHEQFPNTLSFAVELRPRSSFGPHDGFALDPAEIVPTSNEAFSAVFTLLRYTNDSESFLGAQCRQATAPQGTDPENASSNVGLIAGVVVAAVLVAVISVTCFVVFRIRRRRSREKQLEEMNMCPQDDAAKEGGSLESVCAVVKLTETLLQPGTIEVQDPSSNETLHASHIQFEVLSSVSIDGITTVGADESPPTWYNTEGGSSYGNTVLLDGRNPYFPGHLISAALPRSES